MDFISQYHDFDNPVVPEELLHKISESVKDFLYKCRDKWRNRVKFIEKNMKWLDSNIFTDEIANSIQHLKCQLRADQLKTGKCCPKDLSKGRHKYC